MSDDTEEKKSQQTSSQLSTQQVKELIAKDETELSGKITNFYKSKLRDGNGCEIIIDFSRGM